MRLLHRSGGTLAIAESLTGGAVVAAVVAVPGASVVLRGGVVAYATDLKARLLDVDAELLSRVGPVHADVARAMAAGVVGRLGATWGVATTGVAGPGAQDGVAAGTVHVAVHGMWSGATEPVQSHQELHLDGGRGAVRDAARDAALHLLLASVRDAVGPADGPGLGKG